MKITKRQLRRIIKEEMTNQAEAASPKTANEWAEHLGQIIDQDLSSRGVWYEDEGQAVMTSLEMLRRDIKDKTSKKSYR
jgi:hypothetical protein